MSQEFGTTPTPQNYGGADPTSGPPGPGYPPPPSYPGPGYPPPPSYPGPPRHLPAYPTPVYAGTGRSGFGIALLLAVSCVGLMAGIFWAFAVSVMPGLRHVDDVTFVATMQQLNAAIENPEFGFVFVGGVIFPAVAIATELRAGRRAGAGLAALGLAVYLLTLAVTMVVNIPLNEALAAAEPGTAEGAAAARTAFEQPWVVAHLFRTVTCTASMLCLIVVALGARRRPVRR